MSDLDGLREGYIKVRLDYAPTTNGKKFAKWCEEHGFTPLNGGRRAWCSSLSTYLRGASGVAYADGEPFLFYEEDLVDMKALIASERQAAAKPILDAWNIPGRVPKYHYEQQERLKREWPTLYKAIQELRNK